MGEETTDVEETETETEVAIQPTLIDVPLPTYNGRDPSKMTSKIAGANNWLSTPTATGARRIVVVELKTEETSHSNGADGTVEYHEDAKVVDLLEVHGDTGRRLMSTLRQAHRVGADFDAGQETLDVDEVVTDASGVALTKSEIAALRGEPAVDLVRSMLSEDSTPVVALYSDGSRELWPDDFDAGEARPMVGESFENDSGGLVVVKELLDPETGETLEKFDIEAEKERPADDTEAIAPLEDLSPVDDADRFLAETAEAALDDGIEPLDAGVPPLPGDEDFDAGVPPLDADPAPDDPFDVDSSALEPTDEDFEFVDRKISEVRADLDPNEDGLDWTAEQLRRFIEAEKRGRGRKLLTRAGMIDVLEKKLAEIEAKEATDG